MKRAVMTLAVLGLLAVVAVDAAQKALPRDDAAKDAGLAEACRRIGRAAAARDARELLAVLAPKVKVDIEEADRYVTSTDVPEVIAKWPQEKQRRFWRDVGDALALGVAIDEDSRFAYAPYVSEAAGIKPEEMAITGRGVRVRAAPNLAAPVVAVLSWDIVTPDQRSSPHETITIGGEQYAWVRIVLPSGGVGFVPEKYVRYPTGPVLVFQKIDGRWRLVSFVLDV